MSTITMTGTAHPAGAGTRPAGGLRLTRRGRLALFLTCLAMACAVLVAVAGAALGAGEPVPTEVVTVQPGDTLWGIASQVAPGADPRELIDQIHELNTVGANLQVGDKLDVPVSP
ncbi:MAG TPA: LysM peptidoglycan-binding domain-containing protein [Nocardioidaceae bacterium]|nr:LysM peptidoglycan-binding domain-containing protein [Nocardioidaceae bacterium]